MRFSFLFFLFLLSFFFLFDCFAHALHRSLNFHDFIAKCLTKDLKARPTASELLSVRSQQKKKKKTRQQSKFNLDVFRSLQHKFMNTASGKEEMVKVITKTKKIVEERGYGLYDDEAEGLVV